MKCYLCESDSAPYLSKRGHDIYRCKACDLMFVYPLPKTDAVYTEEYFSGAAHGFGYVDYDKDKEPMVPTFQKYLDHIQRAGGQGKLLDVGAATGFFVAIARGSGFDARGVELSEHAAALGREKGLDIRTGTLHDIEGAYDVITMLDVIEHVPDPRKEVQKAAALLQRGGLLVINTPDAGSLTARVLGKRWHAIVPPEHLYYFNEGTLARLLKEEGFDVVVHTKIGKKFTPQYILKTLYKWTKLPLFNTFAAFFSRSPLGKMSVPADLKDNMFTIARKV